MPEILLPIEEVQRRLGDVSRSTVYRLVNKGHLHICKVNTIARFAESEVDAYITSIKHIKSVFG